ncbi:MAG: DNA alkylation repair protein [Bacteroidales bacterium]|nr:DNA alkylation repair protein [Bacteroidales bacterium]
MAFHLKDLINTEYIDRIGVVIQEVVSDFDPAKFKKLVFDKEWENRELKQRTHHIAFVLSKFLDKNYANSSKQIVEIAQKLDGFFEKGEALGNLFLPDFIEDFGVADFENSMIAIEQVTKLMSCEFAVRPFYKNYPEKMMKQTFEWAKNEDYRVRRLASEGCRSKLPWAMSVKYLSENPLEVMKVLEILAFDEEEWVRLSVSNNLNDISKEFPEIVFDFSDKNIGKSLEMNKLLKHALRTLLKKGDKRALAYFGHKYSENIKLIDFQLNSKSVKIGENLEFSFSVKNSGKKLEKVRLEYVVYYQKAKGNLTPKVYKIAEIEMKPDEYVKYERKRSFQLISTRKFYVGLHKIAVIVNGKKFDEKEFSLV